MVERERVGNNNKTGLSPDRGQRCIAMYIIIIILLSTTGVILFLTTYVAASAPAATSYCTNMINNNILKRPQRTRFSGSCSFFRFVLLFKIPNVLIFFGDNGPARDPVDARNVNNKS